MRSSRYSPPLLQIRRDHARWRHQVVGVDIQVPSPAGEMKVADFHPGLPRLPPAAPQHYLDPGQQFAWIERLRDMNRQRPFPGP